MKADDDTYMVVENLRFMLAPYNISRPIYFGHRLKTTVKQGFMSGGAGYVLSKEALVRHVTIVGAPAILNLVSRPDPNSYSSLLLPGLQ